MVYFYFGFIAFLVMKRFKVSPVFISYYSSIVYIDSLKQKCLKRDWSKADQWRLKQIILKE